MPRPLSEPIHWLWCLQGIQIQDQIGILYGNIRRFLTHYSHACFHQQNTYFFKELLLFIYCIVFICMSFSAEWSHSHTGWRLTDVWPCSQGTLWSRESRLLEWIFTLRSQYWLINKTWACLLTIVWLIKMFYVGIVIIWWKIFMRMLYFWGKFKWKSGLLTFEKMVNVAASWLIIPA